MKKKHIGLLIFLNLLIALGYFFENKGAGYTQLSSDLHNSIPVCYKIDDPSLFQNDLYLFNVENVKYYTPFFIQTIRFFAFLAGGDYLLGMNIFATILHIAYGIGWFLLFYKVFNRFFIALFLSVLVRGIVWLPGLEIWGISDMWTMMPRTMYAAAMPYVFFILLHKTRLSFFIASFLIGFIFNLHPITGMGGLLMYVLFVFAANYFYDVKIGMKNYAIAAILMVIGMIPFLSTYFLMTDTVATYNMAEYKEAFSSRIPGFFSRPSDFFEKWFAFKTLFFLIPLSLYVLYGCFVDKKYRKSALILASISFLVIFIFSISVYVERFVNENLGLNLRMSFQIIRAQKLAILPAYFALGYLLLIVTEKLRTKSYWLTCTLSLLLVCIFFSKENAFAKIPFLGDDISRSIFPNYREILLTKEEKQTGMDKMLSYIDVNVPKDAVFYGEYIIRCATKRSVVLDGKGASMLIEGNPQELIQWNKEKKYLESLDDEAQKINFLKEKKKVTHILTKKSMKGNLKLLHAQGNLNLYEIL